MVNISYVSCVEESKGLDTLLEIARILQAEHVDKYVKIDFYGQKKDHFFDEHLADIAMFEYTGLLQPEEVIPTLQEYDALIFPSHYVGKGCPGILVEALSAGLPIIASNWKYNSEFVTNGLNGFHCETFNPKAYVDAIIQLCNEPLRQRMSKSAYAKSEIFSADKARKQMDIYSSRI